MPVNWNPDLVMVGIEELDKQHQSLFDALNRLYDAFNEGQEEAETIRMVDFLGEYVVNHFQYETELMIKNTYPDIEKHSFQHNTFIQTYQRFRERLDKEGPTKSLMIQIYNDVYKWLVGHISNSDKNLGNYLLKKQI